MLVGLVSELVDWILKAILIFFVVLRAKRTCFGGKILRTEGRRRAIWLWICRGVTFLGLGVWCC